MSTVVYTDGACLGNPGGPGGWAWAVPDGPYATGAEPDSTNQRMEVLAALSAVRELPGPLLVTSDSQYVVRCHADRWYEAWERKGWLNSKRQPVANQDLWRPLVELFHARGDELRFRWIRGHSGDPMNDLVDRLAVEAARTQTPRRGTGPPTDLGEADEPTRWGPGRPGAPPAGASPAGATGAGPNPPGETGHRVVILGHRPPELGGYGENRVSADLRRRLSDILAGLRVVHPDIVVLTGLGLGAEQLGAEAAADAGVPYGAVLPFPDPDEVWPPASRAAYRRLAEGAAGVRVLSSKKPTSRPAAGMALGRRDDWLVSHADGAIVVWDGRDRGLGELVRALERRIPDEVWIVPPTP